MPGRTVTVACKIPNGIHLDVMPDFPKDLPFDVDGKTRMIPPDLRTPLGRITLNGFSRAVGVDIEDPTPRAGGFGLTHGVDGDLWDKWLSQNPNAPMVKSGLVFASGKDAKAEAKEKAELKSNLEPMIKDDPRQPKNKGLKIEHEK